MLARTREEHPDARHGDNGAPTRFRGAGRGEPGVGRPDRGLFSISVAAKLAGLHPQTLRIDEREGLIDPARSASGTRRYSSWDIDRLTEICALAADGLNLAGIRRVLQMQEETRQPHAELARLRELLPPALNPPPASPASGRPAATRRVASPGSRPDPGAVARRARVVAVHTR